MATTFALRSWPIYQLDQLKCLRAWLNVAFFLVHCGNQFSKWAGLVIQIQRMMMNILCACCAQIKQNDSKSSSTLPSQQPDSSAPGDAFVGLRHQIIQLPDNRWKCTVCQRTAASHLRARLVTSSCRGVDLAAQGTTPMAEAKNKALQDKLHSEWANTKPGGHALSWDGNGQGTVSCSLCTKKWPYAFKTWRTQILVACSGSSVAENTRRAALRQHVPLLTPRIL